MEEEMSLLRLALALGFMSYASLADWRARRVPDRVWHIMGCAAFIMLALEMMGDLAGWWSLAWGPELEMAHLLVLVPVAILLLEPYRPWGIEWKGIDLITVLEFLVGLAAVSGMLYLAGTSQTSGQMASIPGAMLLMVAMYYAGVIKGGADAKALIALAVLFPAYPALPGLPLITSQAVDFRVYAIGFPFVLLVLMNAAVLNVLSVPPFMCLRNIRRGHRRFPLMLLGYKMPVDEVPKRFVWPMEVVRDGRVVTVLFPKKQGRKNVDDIEREVEALRGLGIDSIWVQPKYPFIIFILAGLVFSTVVGNLLMLLF